jgi:quercetin dioxygenase-like cupin family protein
MQPKVTEPGGGESVLHTGWEAIIKLDGTVTDGSLTVLETRHDPGSGASPHIHSKESETFVVVDGEFTFRVGEDLIEVAAGGLVFGPPGVVHGFEPGRHGGRLLHIFVPSGMEGFFTTPRGNSPDQGDRLRDAYGIKSIE